MDVLTFAAFLSCLGLGASFIFSAAHKKNSASPERVPARWSSQTPTNWRR